MRLFSFLLSAVMLLSALACRAVSFTLAIAVPRDFDPHAYLALSPAPRSIFDTRRMGLA